MSGVKISQIITTLEEKAPCSTQASFDNSGLQVGAINVDCKAALLCIDVTTDIIREAIDLGCNLIISHHPLIFKGLKSIAGRNRVEKCVEMAIRNDITVFSCHTPIDLADRIGVSWAMAARLELKNCKILEPVDPKNSLGYGIVGSLPAVDAITFAEKVKSAFHSPVVRCSRPTPGMLLPDSIRRVAVFGGAGYDAVTLAIEEQAHAFVSSDTKHNFFLDYADQIFTVDIGHYESEECTKQIFYEIIKKKIPNFALYFSQVETNPVQYL